MNKKRIFIFTALILTVCLIFSMFAVACKNDTTESTTDNTENDLLFTNGTFKLTGDTSSVSAPNNWTGAPGSSSSSSNIGTPSGSDDLTKGVVDTSSSAWKSLQKDYSSINIASPGRGTSSSSNKNLDDNKVLMIHNMTATSYKYTSSSHTLSKDSYYKLSVDVKTLDIDKSEDSLAGAYIYVNGSAYSAWEAIDTQGEWKTYVLYIEGSQLADGTITVVLSLGIGAKNTGHMTKGYAFFDNVYLENLSEVDEEDENEKAFTKEDYEAVKVGVDNETGNIIAKYSMTMSDSEFDYASSTTSVPYTPSKFSAVAGYGSGDNSSTSSSDTAKGILDTNTIADSASSLTSLSSLLELKGLTLADLTVAPESVGTRMLYLQNKIENAFGYRASVAMNFDSNSYYKVSVWANTFLQSGSASIRLTNGTSEDSNNYTIDNIDTNGQWTQYTFYVAGNQFRSNQLYLELWLGFGGKNDTSTHAKGAVFFDNTTLEVITADEYNSATESDSAKKIDLLTNTDNITSISLDSFSTQDTENAIKDKSIYKVIDTANFVADDYFKENPGKPVVFENEKFAPSVLAINNYYPTATVISNLTFDGTNVASKNLIEIAPNKAYAISMYIKTQNVDSALGLNISLLKYNKDYKSGQDFEKAYTSLSTFSNLNSENLKDYENENGYTLVTFYVLGAQLEQSQLALSFSLGSGTGSDYATLATGYAYVGAINVEPVSYTDYSSATAGTTVNTAKLTDTAGDSEVSSNGYFDYIDISDTENLYGNDIFTENGSLNGYLGVPTNWSLNNSEVLSKDGAYNNMAGVLNLTNQSQLDAFGIADISNFYNGAEKFFNTEDNQNVLAIKKDDSVNVLGYTSNTISLTANSYYVFNVWAKAENGKAFSIILKTETDSSKDYKFANIVGDGNWHMYTIFVETGISSASVTLSLNAGVEGTANASSTVFFTSATYTTVTSDQFENAQNATASDNIDTQSWLVDSFDDVADAESIASPNNWKGGGLDTNAPTDTDTLASGVIDKNKTVFSDIDLDPDNAEDKAIIDKIFNNTTGDRVLVIYNKENTAYGYTSNSANIEAGKYYKISISVLTYMLALNSDAEDLNENFVPTATITLKANNKTYTFGRKLNNESTDYDKNRIINTSTYSEDGKETIGDWTEYSFYIYAEEDIEDTTATLSVSLGFEGEDYFMTGYVFVDNFAVEEITADEFIAREDVYVENAEGNYYKDGDNYVEVTDENPAPEGATLYKKLNDNEVADYDNSLNSILADKDAVKNNYRIVFTSDDSTAEPEEETSEETPEEPNSMVWLYVVSGVVSGAIIIIVVIYLIKKFAPKRNKKLVKAKKSSAPQKKANKRDQFGK